MFPEEVGEKKGKEKDRWWDPNSEGKNEERANGSSEACKGNVCPLSGTTQKASLSLLALPCVHASSYCPAGRTAFHIPPDNKEWTHSIMFMSEASVTLAWLSPSFYIKTTKATKASFKNTLLLLHCHNWEQRDARGMAAMFLTEGR